MAFNPFRRFHRRPTVRRLLESEVKQRQADIDLAQANLDKYALAIAECGPEDQDFRLQLERLSDDTRREQRKEQILLTALDKLLEDRNVA